jgi:multisubunit Na+/H+ antiporter MnhE subunit
MYAQSLAPDTIVAGVIVAAAVYGFMQIGVHRYERVPLTLALRNIPLVARYAFDLVREVIRSGITIIRLVFSRTVEIDPVLMYFTTDLDDRFEQVVNANAIILTPGTTVIGLEDGEYCVHCLTSSLGRNLDEWVFARHLKEFERRRVAYLAPGKEA